MKSIKDEKPDKKILNIFEMERQAYNKYTEGDYHGAIKIIQNIIDMFIANDDDRGWYLQEIVRYIYPHSKSDSNTYQVTAHRKNRYLLKPKDGMVITNISTISLRRIDSIIEWIQSFDNFQDLQVCLDSILSNLRFGVKADTFEKAFDDLGKTLGFITERPDKEWKAGPDNLWKVRDNEYVLAECKSMVDLLRSEINKDETGQMNNACAWFENNYGDVKVKRIIIIPTKKVNRSTGFNRDVEVIREKNLKSLNANVRSFFMEFKELDLRDLPKKKIQEFINLHKISVNDLISIYSEKPKTY